MLAIATRSGADAPPAASAGGRRAAGRGPPRRRRREAGAPPPPGSADSVSAWTTPPEAVQGGCRGSPGSRTQALGKGIAQPSSTVGPPSTSGGGEARPPQPPAGPGGGPGGEAAGEGRLRPPRPAR